MSNLRRKATSQNDDGEVARMPPKFFEAREAIRAAVEDCSRAGITGDALAAALMSEALPKLVALHGPAGCIRILSFLTATIQSDFTPARAKQ